MSDIIGSASFLQAAGYVVAMAFAILACLVLLLFIVSDISYLADYKKAEPGQARVIAYLGPKDLKGYGRGSRRRWHRYLVQFADTECEVLSSIPGLGSGDMLDVLYGYTKRGTIELFNPYIITRIRTFLIILPFGILWAVACILLAD